MELDDLKHAWQQAGKKQQTKNQNIMELIQHKSYGPVSMLKREFLKHMRFIIMMPVLLIVVYMKDIDSVLMSVMFWSYAVFCIGAFLFFWFE